MKFYKEQDGITLLLAVMVTSMLVLIAVTESFLATKDIQASRAALLTEPAIGAAKAGAESGLWAVKRSNVFLPDCNNATGTALSAAKAEYCKSFSPITVNVVGGVASVLYLYDPNNVNGDVDLNHSDPLNPAQHTAPIYNNLSVTNNGGGNVSVDITRIDGSPVASGVVGPSGQQIFGIAAGPDGADNRMQVVIQSPVNITVDLFTDPLGGMPSAPTVSSKGCSSKLVVEDCENPGQEIYTRKIDVDVGQ